MDCARPDAHGPGAAPALSVIVPVYRTEEEFVRPCLRSLEAFAGLSRHDVEVIVVDDGSGDAYAARLASLLGGLDLRARLLSQANGGQNSARGLGLAHARGDYVLFCDSDDRVVPGELERVLDAALASRAKILCYNYDRVKPDGTLIGHAGPWEGGPSRGGSLSAFVVQCRSLWRQLYLREALLGSGVTLVEGPRLGEDSASAVALLLGVGEAWSIGAAPYAYVERRTSVSCNPEAARLLDVADAAAQMLERISKEMRSEYEGELEAWCINNVLLTGSVWAIRAHGADARVKGYLFGWMDAEFPRWRERVAEIRRSKRGKARLIFWLVVSGRWRLLSLLLGAKAALRRRATA